MNRRRHRAILFAVTVLVALGVPLAARICAAQQPDGKARRAAPNLLLVTLDTTRADHLGCYGDERAATPVLDRLAARGTRYARALTTSPLTLPAHASILTGLAPRAHGLRDNGIGSLPADVPTLATVLTARGYASAAFVASRVLDRRFGLDRGFAVYDDAMAAERRGEYGYPERDAAAVTDAALAWLAQRPRKRPFFLWVHYYDAHAPYTPPGRFAEPGGYAGEIAYVDAQLGRLLAALSDDRAGTVIAAVGDHGESLGEHGEDGHGIFLYGATLQVPLILAGPGVGKGKVREDLVSTVDLAPHLLALLERSSAGKKSARGEPGAASGGGLTSGRRLGDARYAYSETHMPANAYGWAPLSAVTDAGHRLIRAPEPELYDLAADPGERHNVVGGRRRVYVRLARALREHEAATTERDAATVAADEELARSLRSLGYLGGASGGEEGDGIDPKQGIELLEEFERAKRLLVAGAIDEALAVFTRLVERNPSNVPFLNRLAATQLAAGRGEAAIATYRRSVERNPTLDFTHLQLAEAYLRLDRKDEAIAEYRLVLEINPRFADAWMRLAELSPGLEEAAAVLEEAVAAETRSAGVFSILGELQRRLGRPRAAAASARQALEVIPTWPPAWVLRGRLAAARGEHAAAERHYRKALESDPGNAQALEGIRRLQGGRGG